MTAAFEKQIKATGSMNVDMKAMSMRKGSVRYKIHKITLLSIPIH